MLGASKPAGRQQSGADAWPRLDDELFAHERAVAGQQFSAALHGLVSSTSGRAVVLTTFRLYNTLQSTAFMFKTGIA